MRWAPSPCLRAKAATGVLLDRSGLQNDRDDFMAFSERLTTNLVDLVTRC